MDLYSRDNKHCGTLYFTFKAPHLEKKSVISRSTFPQCLHDYSEPQFMVPVDEPYCSSQ